MTIKTILVPLDGSESGPAVLEAALAAARVFGAHLDVLHVRADPRDMMPFLAEPATCRPRAEDQNGNRDAIAGPDVPAVRTHGNKFTQAHDVFTVSISQLALRSRLSPGSLKHAERMP